MSTSSKIVSGRARTNRTRSEILAAAEQLFASQGYAATRLEDVAEKVDLTRAALFYHFKDKQMLYEAMIANAFASLNKELHELLDSTAMTISERMESAIAAWVDAIIARPTLARLILRFVADGYIEASQRIFWDDQLLPMKFFSLFEEGRRTGELRPLYEHPFHAASSIVGTTVFYVGAISTLIPEGLIDPLAPGMAAIHKEETLRSGRRLLGINTNQTLSG